MLTYGVTGNRNLFPRLWIIRDQIAFQEGDTALHPLRDLLGPFLVALVFICKSDHSWSCL